MKTLPDQYAQKHEVDWITQQLAETEQYRVTFVFVTYNKSSLLTI